MTVYNELNLIRDKGYEGDKLQVLSPKDYNSAIPGDVVFTTEKFLEENRQAVEAFLKASLRGWRYCLDHREEALDIVLTHNPELEREQQRKQLDAVLQLLQSGPAAQHGIGYLDQDSYRTAERVLYNSGQISKHVDAQSCLNLTPWNTVPVSVKTFN